MAKVSPVSIKYMIYAEFKADGPLEKPDVIGAIFGQTEGLLGNELEMRELQKEGKIGRIEVDLEIVDGKSVGTIKVPTALDKSETTLIGAALETIDRVGPTEAKVSVSKIEDVRGGKRDFILNRAKELLEGLGEGNMSTAMSKTLKEESRISKIQEYGDEKLPAGDLSGDEIIVVEGRADVVNLLKNRVNNVIGMNGTKLPAEIRKLGEKKEITLFIDGDRGGKLIAKNVIQNAKVAYVAVAPDGKEVEELEGKEILMSLRKKLTLEEFMRKERMEMRREESGKKETNDINPEKAKEKIREGYECSLKGTKKIALFNENFEIMRQVGAKEAIKSINYSKENISAIAIDGTATNALIEACEQKDIAFLGATNFSSASSSKVKLISL